MHTDLNTPHQTGINKNSLDFVTIDIGLLIYKAFYKVRIKIVI